MKLCDSILKLNNLGEARAKRFAELAIYTISDLIQHFPREYEDRSIITNIADAACGATLTIRAKVCEIPRNSRLNNKVVTKLLVQDNTGALEIVWFNQPYLKNNFIIGDEYFFTGKVDERKSKLQMVAPDCERPKADSVNTGRIVPIYPATAKLSQKLMRNFIKEALEAGRDEIQEFLPQDVREAYKLMGRKEAVFNIHFPINREAFFHARQRLVFEELFLLQMSLFRIKGNTRKERTEISITNCDYSGLKLPFSLTNSQKKVMDEIIRDFTLSSPMYRLIQGDVGSGKTIVAVIAAYIAVLNGYQVVIMAPTEVLAKQHYESFLKLFCGYAIKTVLLCGSMKKKEKEEALQLIANGEAQMIVGTHAVIQERVLFRNLGLVITDEQHRFGVKQRARLSEKGQKPHVLVMSATPIPRTLAMVLYCDMDISVIDELPPGRQQISTFAVTSAYRQRMFGFVEKEVLAGRQVYIVCPAIEESPVPEIKNVTNYAKLIREYLENCNIGILHGKMKPQEKQKIMDGFYSGDISVIISTTVIEVGVNVSNATVMIIENAERFGLAQLHQLRGRVGRGHEKSYCILVSDTKGDITKQRLNAMTKTGDGFEISELDLKLRGPGDFFGTRQHGLPEMKIANIIKDVDIMAQARQAAESLQENRRFLSDADRIKLENRLEDFLGKTVDIM